MSDYDRSSHRPSRRREREPMQDAPPPRFPSSQPRFLVPLAAATRYPVMPSGDPVSGTVKWFRTPARASASSRWKTGTMWPLHSSVMSENCRRHRRQNEGDRVHCPRRAGPEGPPDHRDPRRRARLGRRRGWRSRRGPSRSVRPRPSAAIRSAVDQSRPGRRRPPHRQRVTTSRRASASSGPRTWRTGDVFGAHASTAGARRPGLGLRQVQARSVAIKVVQGAKGPEATEIGLD